MWGFFYNVSVAFIKPLAAKACSLPLVAGKSFLSTFFGIVFREMELFFRFSFVSRFHKYFWFHFVFEKYR
jgi:hypothetical protein